MWRALRQMVEAGLDLLFPSRCVGCDVVGTSLCPTCVQSAARLEEPCCAVCAQSGVAGLCERCRKQPLAIEAVRAPFRMEGVAREAVHRLKYSNLRALASPMATHMVVTLRQTGWAPQVLVPVPLHPRRARQRGYNQAALLCRGISHLTGIPINDVLIRREDTPSQVRAASEEERFANVEGAFPCRGDVSGQRVLLADDVCTTGATLNACAVALKEAGAATVWGLTFAREA